jgi:ligand-binding sensor domain-containing protein
MKIRNFFLTVFLFSIFVRSPILAEGSKEASPPAISVTKQVWRTFTTADGLIDNNVYRIASDASGNVWFGKYGGGASKFDGVNWTTYNNIVLHGNDVRGNLWFSTNNSVSKFDGSTWITYTEADGLVINTIDLFASDLAGNAWFGSKYGVSKFDGTSWTSYAPPGGTIAFYVPDMASDRVGNLWFANDLGCDRAGCLYGGVTKFNGTTWTSYTSAAGLASNNVLTIASDNVGNVWFGTGMDTYTTFPPTYGGVSKFDGYSWTTYTPDDGLADYEAQVIANGKEGDVWVGFGRNGTGVSKFDGISWTTYTIADGMASNSVWAITSDLVGNVWIGTGDSGVSKFDGARWINYSTADGLAGNWVYLIAKDTDGNLWFGTDGGVSEVFTIHLNGNYASGAPGSYFNLSGDHFNPNQSTPITVNGFHLGDLPISSHGTFTFTLSTTNANQGIYYVKVGDQPALRLRFSLNTQNPIRPKEGDFTTFDIPAGIAFTQEFYLPFLHK